MSRKRRLFLREYREPFRRKPETSADFLHAPVGVASVAALGAREDGIVGGPRPSAKLSGLVVGEGLLDFGFGVHDERAVLDDGFADGASLKKKELGFFGTLVDE